MSAKETGERRARVERRSSVDRRTMVARRADEEYPQYPLLAEFYMRNSDDDRVFCTEAAENCGFLACSRDCEC